MTRASSAFVILIKMEVQKEKENPQPPIELKGRAFKIWGVTVEELRKSGALFSTDLNLLASYCKELANYEHACSQIEEFGEVIQGIHGPTLSPWHTIKHKSLKAACDIGRLFGVTPNARQALKPEKKEPIKKLGVFSNKPKIA